MIFSKNLDIRGSRKSKCKLIIVQIFLQLYSQKWDELMCSYTPKVLSPALRFMSIIVTICHIPRKQSQHAGKKDLIENWTVRT